MQPFLEIKRECPHSLEYRTGVFNIMKQKPVVICLRCGEYSE